MTKRDIMWYASELCVRFEHKVFTELGKPFGMTAEQFAPYYVGWGIDRSDERDVSAEFRDLVNNPALRGVSATADDASSCVAYFMPIMSTFGDTDDIPEEDMAEYIAEHSELKNFLTEYKPKGGILDSIKSFFS